jgi:hypothetical protein
MNVISENPTYIAQRLVINSCINSTKNNFSCQSLSDLFKMTSGGRLFMIINIPAGFDYTTGSIDQSDYSV